MTWLIVAIVIPVVVIAGAIFWPRRDRVGREVALSTLATAMQKAQEQERDDEEKPA